MLKLYDKKCARANINVREIFAIRNVSENFERRIRQRSRVRLAVQRGGKRRRTAFNTYIYLFQRNSVQERRNRGRFRWKD